MQERFRIDALEIEALTNEHVLPFITEPNVLFMLQKLPEMHCTQLFSAFTLLRSASVTVLLRFVIDALVEYNLLNEYETDDCP